MKHLKEILIFIAILFCTIAVKAQNGFRFPSTENSIVKLHTHYHFQETNANYQGLNYVIEAGYTGKIYALLGFESFNALKGGTIDNKKLPGYTSFHGAIGLNLTHGQREQWKYHAGIRLVKAYRGPLQENRYRAFIGWEAGITYQLTKNLGLGLRGTIDNRRDQDIFNWKINNVASAFFTLTYQISEL